MLHVECCCCRCACHFLIVSTLHDSFAYPKILQKGTQIRPPSFAPRNRAPFTGRRHLPKRICQSARWFQWDAWFRFEGASQMPTKTRDREKKFSHKIAPHPSGLCLDCLDGTSCQSLGAKKKGATSLGLGSFFCSPEQTINIVSSLWFVVMVKNKHHQIIYPLVVCSQDHVLYCVFQLRFLKLRFFDLPEGSRAYQ